MIPVYVFTPLGPATEPVTAAELRAGMRIDPDIDPVPYGAAARGLIERFCGRPWAESSFRLELYSGTFTPLPLAVPFLSMTASTYKPEGGGDETELPPGAFEIHYGMLPAGLSLTSTAPAADSYRFEYKAGINEPLPVDIKQAIISAAAWIFNEPDGAFPARVNGGLASLPPVIQRLAGPYRMDLFSWGRLWS